MPLENFMFLVFIGLSIYVLVEIYKAEQKAKQHGIESEYHERPNMICTQCSTIGNLVTVYPGSGWITVLLFGLGIIPGLIYGMWRLTSARKVCPVCKHEAMIPVNSPGGQILVTKQRISYGN